MKCILMNKNTPIVEVELEEDLGTIIEILNPINLNYLPVGIDKGNGTLNKKGLNEWWRGRAIPASRSGIRSALEKLEISYSEQLLMKCYGLSLSDQYWMKPVKSNLTWSCVNFFENEFSDDVGDILLGQPIHGNKIDMMSPCNTSDGWLKKKWKILDGKRCLIKAGSNPYMQEPLNEVIATKLHKRLNGQNYVNYSLLWEKNIPYSVCEDFIDVDTELVTAISINKSVKKQNHHSTYEHFLHACEKLGIPYMKESVDYLIIFDYLMANTDRHFGNFGAIRNVNTLEWIGATPIFDSGTSLWHDKLAKTINGYHGVETKPFYADADRQMNLVTDFSQIPFEQLTGFKDDIREVLVLSNYMDEERIEVIVNAVDIRLERLKMMALKNK